MAKVTKPLAGVKHIKANSIFWKIERPNKKRDKKISFDWNDAIKTLKK